MEMQGVEVGIRGDDQGDLALDVIPDSSSPGVREWLKQLPRLFMARQILLTLGVVGRYQYIATNASAKEANVLVKTQNGLFSLLKSIDATSLMLQSFQSGANNILEKLKVAYLYLLDGFPDFAKADIDAIAKDIKTMRESTEKALVVVRKTANNIEEAQKQASEWKNGRDGELVKIQQTIDKLNDEYRGLCESQMGGSGEQATIGQMDDSGLLQSRSFLDFLKINTIEFLKDLVSLLITVAVFVTFFVCACHLYNSVCGWATLFIGILGFVLRFGVMKLWRPKHIDYKPVIPIILIVIILSLFPCQLLLPCKPMCFAVFILAPPLTILLLYLWYQCVPEHWFFKVKVSGSLLPIFGNNSVSNQGSTATESIEQRKQRIRGELSEKSKVKQRIEESSGIGDADLTKCFLGKALSDLKSVTGIIQQSTAVIERWYKECKDIIEPSMDRTIQKAQSVPEGELRNYWNSMTFKKEVVGYYCRWRALQVYCETLRSECREKRATLESHYVENLYPRDAVVRAWELAHEEVADLEVARLVREHQQRMSDGNGHDLTNLLNIRNRDLKLD